MKRAAQVLDTVLHERTGGEARARYVDPTAEELAACPQVRARLQEPGVRLPLVAVDGQVVLEGSVSAAMVLSYLVDGHIPNIPQGHKVSVVPPEEEPHSPERGVLQCVARWWRRWRRSSSS